MLLKGLRDKIRKALIVKNTDYALPLVLPYLTLVSRYSISLSLKLSFYQYVVVL